MKQVTIINSEDLTTEFRTINGDLITEQILRDDLGIAEDRECEVKPSKNGPVYEFVREDDYAVNVIFVVTYNNEAA